MKKWLDKYDVPQAQNGIEGTMGGLTDQGFNYNGAWGGQFMMGGSLPGAVGFTYARTQGAAPANGPYAKKTKASAENGMKFYQEGLDWKPKNISRNGTEIDDAQFGKSLLRPLNLEDISNFFSALSVPQKAATKLVTGKYQTPSEAMGIENKAGAFATDMILDPVNLIGAGIVGKQAIAFKPKPGMMYRGLGQEGFEDAVQSGVFRPKQYGYAPKRSLAEKVSTPKQFGSTFYAPSEKFDIINNYGAKYVAEVPFNTADFFRRYGRKDWSWSTPREIPITEGRILKKDWLRGYKEVKPKKKQDGGEIPVDPNGYWNPDNWGKPVIIPSNQITMQGVDQPLIGVSDTGDIQYMEPGEDYEFEGNRVTEFPIAKGGMSINNIDAQPIKKLDQLLNFTNYNKPTKGGWLDKYK